MKYNYEIEERNRVTGKGDDSSRYLFYYGKHGYLNSVVEMVT